MEPGSLIAVIIGFGLAIGAGIYVAMQGSKEAGGDDDQRDKRD